MWLEKIAQLQGAHPHAPGDAAGIASCEQALGHPLPAQLKDLLLTTDGVTGEWGEGVVWPIERIRADNLEFRTFPTFPDVYMPFDPLIFFGDNGGGDQFALVRGVDRLDVFRWDHETDSRYWVAASLADYLERLADGSIDP